MGSIVVITGGGAGVAVGGHDLAPRPAPLRALARQGGPALAVRADMADAQAVEDAADKIDAELARSTSGSTTRWRRSSHR